MSSASAIDFQIANTANLEKIERFMNAAAYQENIEYSSNFNTRLCIERRLRLPFFDPQTGVAQNHCSLFMARRQRMPGFRDGQIYSYPGKMYIQHTPYNNLFLFCRVNDNMILTISFVLFGHFFLLLFWLSI